MVDEGTGALSAIDVSDALARIGADYDVDVGADATDFSLTTLTRFADRGASLLADIADAAEPARDATSMRVRQLRLDRLRQLKDLPPAVAERAFLRLLYGDHPYGHLAIGTEDGASTRSRSDDVAAFHAATFQPSRATLVVVGAMPHEELLDVAERRVRRLGRPSHGAHRRPAAVGDRAGNAGPAAAGRRAARRRGAVRAAHRPPVARRDTPDYPALLVMNAVLGGQFVSRVNLKLREEKGYTYGARTGFDWRRGHVAVRRCRRACTPASTADAIRDSLAEIDGAAGHASADRRRAVAGQGVADARVSAELRNRAAGRAIGVAAARCTACPTPTSRSSFRRSTP